MRLAVVTTSYPTSEDDPSGHFVQTEVRALARAGHDVHVIAPGTPGTRRQGAVTVHRLSGGTAFGWPGALSRLRESPHRVLGATAFAARAARLLAELSPERVIAHWIVPCGWPIASSVDAPLEIVVHGSDARLVLSAPKLAARALLARLARRGARFRFVSAELRDALCALHPALRSASRVEPCAIDVTGALTRDEARTALGVEALERLVVIASRLTEEKRVATALSAAELVPDARVVVLGDGPLLAELASRFPDAELLGRVPRREALSWIAAADVVLSASEHEGAPSVVREARALGTPVVARRAGDLAAWAETDRELWVI